MDWKRLIYPFLTAALLLAGCTKEDMSDCPTDIRVRLSFTYNDTGSEQFAEEVGSAMLYLYGSDGTLIESRPLTSDEILAKSVRFQVPAGASDYTAVLWGNYAEEHYTVSGHESIGTMNLALNHTGGVVSQRPCHLLHGVLAFETDAERTPVDKTMSLRKLTNTVHVIIEGAVNATYASESGTPYSVQITGSNGSYNHDASKAACQKLTYLPEYERNVSGYYSALGAHFTTMHLCTGDDMRVTVYNGSQTLYDEPLVPLLMQSDEIKTDEDLWRHDEYTLLFDANMVLTAIKVLDWTYIDSSEGGI